MTLTTLHRTTCDHYDVQINVQEGRGGAPVGDDTFLASIFLCGKDGGDRPIEVATIRVDLDVWSKRLRSDVNWGAWGSKSPLLARAFAEALITAADTAHDALVMLRAAVGEKPEPDED